MKKNLILTLGILVTILLSACGNATSATEDSESDDNNLAITTEVESETETEANESAGTEFVDAESIVEEI